MSLRREVDVLKMLRSKVDSHPVLHSMLPQTPFRNDQLYVRPSADGAAALFTPVGTTVAHELSALLKPAQAEQVEALWREVLLALVTLHLCGCRHGDPRLPNLIRVVDPESRGMASNTRGAGAGTRTLQTSRQDHLMWIDFREADLFPLAHDALLCMRSFFHVPSDFGPQLQQFASDYERMLAPLVLKPVASMDVLAELPPPAATWSAQIWRTLGSSLCGVSS